MRIPVGTLTSATLEQVAKRLSDVASAISAGWSIEHAADGRHKTVTASGPLYERGRTTALGEWTPVPFAAANFSANGAMTWTVAASGVTTNRYTYIGKTLLWSVWVTGTVGGVANTTLQLTLPNGAKAAYAAAPLVCFCYDNTGTYVDGNLRIAQGGTQLLVDKATPANWTAGGATATVRFTVALEVQ